jgi:Helix-turn-helix domain
LTREEAALTHRELTDRLRHDLGWDTVWLHMLFLAYSLQTPEGQAAAVGRPLVYRALGLDRRTDLTRAEKDARCDEELRRLGSLGLTILRAQLNGQELDYHKRSTVVWQLAKDEYGQARFEPDGAGFVKKWEEWQILVQPGAWAPTFLYRDPLRQFGYITPEMFNIDRRRAPWGVALAVLLAFEARFELQPWLRIPNRKIIEFAGGNPQPTDRVERLGTTERLQHAIAEQPKWGWTPDYREWPDYLRPDLDADRADRPGDGTEATPRRRPRGYFEQLVGVATWFKVPTTIYTLNRQAAPTGARRLGKPPAKPAPAPGERPAHDTPPDAPPMAAGGLREIRRRLGLSQTALGERLGVSGAMVSFMEQGKRRIPPEVVARLRAVTAALTDGTSSGN